VTEELGQKILNLDGLGLKIATFVHFSAVADRNKILSAVNDGVNKVKYVSKTVTESA
jgi:hypothetical protein